MNITRSSAINSILLVRLSAAFIAQAVPAAAGRPGERPSVISLVPVANWRLLNSEKLDVNAISQWGGEPAIDAEYGVRSIEHSTYRLLDNAADVIIEEGPDASAAYGLFTYYQTEGMSPEKGLVLTAVKPGLALMARKRSFIRIVTPAGASPSAGQQQGLLIIVGGIPSSSEVMANLPADLPSEGRIAGSEKYLLGPQASRRLLPGLDPELIGFSQGAEAQLARYRVSSARASRDQSSGGTILAVTYPTPQIAQQRFASIEKQLGVNQDRGIQSVYGKRRGSFVFLTLNADSATASKLLSQFNVAQHVSWDQRYPSKPVVWQMVELVIANFFLAFILAGMAVIGGVIIALSRRIAGKWRPDWDWGNPDGEALITLKLR